MALPFLRQQLDAAAAPAAATAVPAPAERSAPASCASAPRLGHHLTAPRQPAARGSIESAAALMCSSSTGVGMLPTVQPTVKLERCIQQQEGLRMAASARDENA